MTLSTPKNRILDLKRIAQKRWGIENELTKIFVQVGHCSTSVGASGLVQSLTSTLSGIARIVISGCDGACFDAPKVVVLSPGGLRTVFTRVGSRDEQLIERLVSEGTEVIDNQANVDFFTGQTRVTMEFCGEIDSTDFDDYVMHGGYSGLATALEMSRDAVTEEVKESALRGRGGAYFPAAQKWESARAFHNSPKYLVVNAEEGEPGIFKDRHLMEGIPYRIIEGATIASYASGVEKAFIYINAEADLSTERIQTSLGMAHQNGVLGEDILGSGYSLDIQVIRGAGGYVCGEETTLLNTMEGYRREPRLRPPFPTEKGFLGKPTVINNVETLASLPFIMEKGSNVFSRIGSRDSSGTKIISLSGAIQRTGIVEVPMGTTLREIIFSFGGGPNIGHTITGIAVGGPSSGIFPVSMFDTPIAPGILHDSGVILGAGGVIALDEKTNVLQVVRQLAAYNAEESCGKCTPCREGTPRIVEVLDRMISGIGTTSDLDELIYLAEVVGSASLCGLGQAAGGPVNSAIRFFGDEIAELSRSNS